MKTYRRFENKTTGRDTSPDICLSSDTSTDLRAARRKLLFDLSSLQVCWPSLAAADAEATTDESPFAFTVCRFCGSAHFVTRGRS